MLRNKRYRGYIDDDVLIGFASTVLFVLVLAGLGVIIHDHDKHAYAVQPGELRITNVRCERSWSVVRGDEFECVIQARAAEPGDALNAQVIDVGDVEGPGTVGIYHPGDVE